MKIHMAKYKASNNIVLLAWCGMTGIMRRYTYKWEKCTCKKCLRHRPLKTIEDFEREVSGITNP